jgi:hypothetical protein
MACTLGFTTVRCDTYTLASAIPDRSWYCMPAAVYACVYHWPGLYTVLGRWGHRKL